MGKRCFIAALLCSCLVGQILIPVKSNGQLSKNVRIDNVDILFKDNLVNIPYSIINSTNSESYVVWVDVFNEKDEKINAQSFSGDINKVVGNGDKQIFWDAKKDGINLDDKIYAKVSAKLLPSANMSKALIQSTAYPGWGDYQFKPGRPHWILGAAGYSMLGASVFMYLQSNSSYDKYLTSGLPSSEDPSFNAAKNQRSMSYIFATVGVAFWAYDYFSILKKAKNFKKVKTEVIASDPHLKLYANSSSLKRITTRGLPPNLYADLSFSDENNNGLLEAREKALLNIILSNQGKGDALQLEVNVTDSTLDKSMIIGNASQKINVLKAGESIKVSIPITGELALKTATHKLTINVTERYGYDMDPALLVLNALARQSSQLVYSGLEIIDSGTGTAAITEDGKIQAGEQVRAKVVVQNIGKDIARNTTYSVRSSDPNVYIENSEGTIGNLMSGEVKELYFTLSPNKRVVAKGNLPIFITLKEDIGLGNLTDFPLPIALNQKPPQANIVTVKTNVDLSDTKSVARFEFKSNKFRANVSNIVNIASVVQSKIKRSNSVGVVFGVNSYKELPQAPYADKDANIIKDYFEKVLGVEQVIIYTNEQVSGFIFDDVFNPENGELQKAVAKGETEVFVFYSGHGIPDKSGENVYLFPSDGKMSRLESQGYNIEKLYHNLSKLGAKHVTVILDACFSGGSRKTEKIKTENLIAQKGVKVRPKNSWLVDSNFTIVSSSTGDETSLGFDATETGLFTYYFCAGLQGKADVNNDKKITLGELKNYVIQNVMETSKKISGLQTPIFTGDENSILTTY